VNSKVTIILDGQETTFELAQSGQTVLEAALKNGMDAPYSCRGGVCTTCKAKVLEGSVKMDANYALTNTEIKDGYVLACQSHPTSEMLKLTWDL
jgi:ring-1,2-phenylacetyl-CoA epoxidase subunit PaaE